MIIYIRKYLQKTLLFVIAAWALLLTPSCLSRFDIDANHIYYVEKNDKYYRIVSTVMPWGSRLTWDEVNRELLEFKEHEIKGAPKWSVLAKQQSVVLGSSSAIEQSSGWPFASFKGAVWLSGSDYPSLGYVYPHPTGYQSCSIVYDGRDRAVYSKSVLIIVYEPIVSGIILNTCTYTLFALSAIMLYNAVRRRIGARIARCEQCGYDVSGLCICPECGRRVCI